MVGTNDGGPRKRGRACRCVWCYEEKVRLGYEEIANSPWRRRKTLAYSTRLPHLTKKEYTLGGRMPEDIATIPIEHLSTAFLQVLQKDIRTELWGRRKDGRVKRRLASLKSMTYKDHKYEDILQRITQENQYLCLAIPATIRMYTPNARNKYLPLLLSQPWENLFPSASTVDSDSYVYAHVDPRKEPIRLTGMRTLLPGQPFYIGKGTGKRAWDLKRNQGHGKRIKQILDEGFPADSITQVIRNELCEQDALVLEAKLIYFFGSIYDEFCAGILFNLLDHMRPVFQAEMRLLPTKKMCKQGEI